MLDQNEEKKNPIHNILAGAVAKLTTNLNTMTPIPKLAKKMSEYTH